MTIRLRLTLLYGLLFLMVGAGLLAINYAFLRHNLPAQQISKVSAKDVVLRAQKLASDPTLTTDERSHIKQVANASPQTAVKLAAALPTRLAKQLLADLPTDVRAHALSALLRQSLVALAISGSVAFALGWIVAGRILRPIHAITSTAKELSASTFHQRIALDGPDDELKRLADTFDDMLNRLEAAFTSQQRFVADASHELRTPLTIMRTELDVTLRRPNPTNRQLLQMAAVLSDTVDRSDALVTSLLALATSDHGLESIDRVDLANVARDVLARQAPEAARDGITIEAQLDPAPLDGDAGLLDRLIHNLVENSIRHNIVDGWVHIQTNASDNQIQLTITNSTGPISPDDAASIFEPFHRLTRHHDAGHGLGLAIVKSITIAHYGCITATPNGNESLSIAVTLPQHRQTLDQPPDSPATQEA